MRRRRAEARNASSALGDSALDHRVRVLGSEQTERERDAALLELAEERRPEAGRDQFPDDDAVLVDLADPELEELLERDHVRLHALHLGDRSHVARTVLDALDVNDQVEGARNLLTDRADRIVTVELRGGNLGIEWRAAGPEAEHVFMTGEAVEVFKGEIEVGNDELVSAE